MPDSANTEPSRRQFLVRTASAVGVVGLAKVCGGCAAFHKQDIQVEAPESAESVALDLAKYPQIANPGGIVRIEGRDGDARVMVVRKADGGLVALSMECTHWGCDVEWDKTKNEFECPCHGSRFDTAGQVLEGPADEPLPSYPVAEENGVVTVRFKS